MSRHFLAFYKVAKYRDNAPLSLRIRSRFVLALTEWPIKFTHILLSSKSHFTVKTIFFNLFLCTSQNWSCKICSRYQSHYRLEPTLCSRDAMTCSRDNDRFPMFAQVCKMTCSPDTGVCNTTCSRHEKRQDKRKETRLHFTLLNITINRVRFITKIMTTKTS